MKTLRKIPQGDEMSRCGRQMGCAWFSTTVSCAGSTWRTKDPAFFATVTVDHGSVAWPNGVDLDPLVLRGDLEPADR